MAVVVGSFSLTSVAVIPLLLFFFLFFDGSTNSPISCHLIFTGTSMASPHVVSAVATACVSVYISICCNVCVWD